MADREHPPVDEDGVRYEDRGRQEWQPQWSFPDQKLVGDSRGADLGRPARDASGHRPYAADGKPLYEPPSSPQPYKLQSGSSGGGWEDQAAAGLTALVVAAALAVIAVGLWLMSKAFGWWWPRLSNSLRRDRENHRLSWPTLALFAPIVLLVLVAISALASTPSQPTIVTSNVGYPAQGQTGPAATNAGAAFGYGGLEPGVTPLGLAVPTSGPSAVPAPATAHPTPLPASRRLRSCSRKFPFALSKSRRTR